MLKKLYNFLLDTRDRQRIGIALSKGGAMMNARVVDATKPSTWEFSGFSQNGEDGILDVLSKKLSTSNRYFVEIGAADGIENNTGWLIAAERYNGILIEGDPHLVDRAKRVMTGYSIGVDIHNMFVMQESAQEIMNLSMYTNPDVFSLDIDGNDYYIAKSLLDIGFRPKIFVVEYNSAYGPDETMTIKYKADFSFKKEHETQLYYGVSISGWMKLFEEHGYRFVTVDTQGVNGFFVDPNCFHEPFLEGIMGTSFQENQSQLRRFRKPWQEQFALISDQNFSMI